MSEININAMVDLHNQLIVKAAALLEVGAANQDFRGSTTPVSQLIHDAQVLSGVISTENYEIERQERRNTPQPSPVYADLGLQQGNVFNQAESTGSGGSV